MITPTEIKRLENNALRIRWSDGLEKEIPSKTLRINCPCADCRMKRGEDTHSTPLTPKKFSLKVIQNSADEECDLQSIWGVGQYALGIKWGDGHDTGIYTYGLLRELSEI